MIFIFKKKIDFNDLHLEKKIVLMIIILKKIDFNDLHLKKEN